MELSSILTNARSANLVIRQEAESIITQLSDNSYDEILFNLTIELSNNNSVIENRLLAATLIKNLIGVISKYEGKYLSLNSSNKDKIKQMLLLSLYTNNSQIQKFSGLIISSISKLELPLNQWPEIINLLISQAENENIIFRKASITTLMFISQELEGQKCFNSTEIDNILNVLIKNINFQENNEIKESALKCLNSYLPFAGKNFSINDERKIIFQLIYCQLKSSVEIIRVNAMKCLVEIQKNFYDYLIDEIKSIYDFTIFHIDKDTKFVALQAYEFWLSLSEEEISRRFCNSDKKVYNFCKNASIPLMDIILKQICIENDSDIEEDESNLNKCAFYLLSNFCQLCDYNLIDRLLNFISNNINSKDSKFREAAIIVLTAIIEFPNKDQSYNNIISYLTKIIERLNDSNKKVRETSAWCMEKICEKFSIHLTQNKKVFDSIITSIMALIEKSNNKITVHLLCGMHYLAIALQPKDFQTSNLFSFYLNSVLSCLIKLVLNENCFEPSNNVSQAACITIMSFIDNSAPDVKIILQNFFTQVLNYFSTTITNKNYFKSEEQRKTIQAYLANIIESCLNSGKIIINNIEMGNSILILIIESFKERNNIYEEGLLACSALGLLMKDQFSSIYHFFYPFLIFALNKHEEVSICKVGLTVTSDLIQTVGSDLKLDEIIPLIINIINNPIIDKSLKIGALNVISDLFVECREKVLNYFDKIMEVLSFALEAATYLPDEQVKILLIKDEDMSEYFENLREQSLECISCIIQSLKEIKLTNNLINFVPVIVGFINKINLDNFNPNTNIMKNSIGIIADFCEIYGKNMKSLLNQNLLTEIHQKLNRNAKNKKMKNFLTFCEKSISASFN